MQLVLILFIIWLIVKLASQLSLLRVQHQWHAKQTVITEYKTPHNLTPAELGYIFDRRFGRNELLATVVHLYQKKKLRLTPLSGDIVITNEKAKKLNRGLDDSEAVLTAAITYSHDGQRLWSEISSIASRETGVRWQYERALVGQLIDKGYLTERAKNEPFIDRFVKSLLSFTLTWVVYFTTVGQNLSGSDGFSRLDSFVTILFLLPLFGLVWIGFYLYLSILSHEIRISAGLPRFATQKLRDQWRDVVGFRDFLRVVEWHRLRSMPEIDNPSLAYCLACGFHVDVPAALRAKGHSK